MEFRFTLAKVVAAVGLLLGLNGAWAAGHCDASPEIGRLVGTLPIVRAKEPRLAFVAGNTQYQAFSPTPNAVNDARDMAAVLSRLGFGVICGIDLTQGEFLERLRVFRQKLDQLGPEAVGLFYYAGHGVQIDNTNFIVPVDARPADSSARKGAGGQGGRGMQRIDPAEGPEGAVNLIELDRVLRQILDAGNKQGSNLIILDACRDNPLSMKGWAKPRASFNIKGLFWAFGTGYGKTAADGSGRNGVFTKHILERIGIEGATVNQLMMQVTAAVDDETRSAQTPETGGSLVRDFMFIPGSRILVNTTYEETPLWLRVIYGIAALLSLLLVFFYYRYRGRMAWTRGIDLTEKLVVDAQVLEEVKKKSRLVTEDIVGYVKDVRQKKLLALVTPRYDLVLGRNENVNLVIGRDTISGQHACLGWDKERRRFWIEDLNSSNGTWWGKKDRLEPGKRYPLESGRVFYLADERTPLVVIAHKDRIEGG
ncbi:MAG: caspase family protein [Gammaproteobacteria bacterium]|nr:caspase family protein [Gammaproteobacteria bacterium]MBU1655044.1 caspase family protein [Gammaproteobacteria bacterium]MBU1961541.1 caspase family protein [Gammaproteobacteria bacterium]